MPEPADTELVARRRFLELGFALVSAPYVGAIVYPVYRYLVAPAREAERAATVKNVELKDADKLPRGASLTFRFGSRPAMLIHHRDGTWACLSAVCTHLGCTVQFEVDRERIFCACHGGVYDARTGANVSGPPPKPLASYHLEVRDGLVAVSRA